MYLSTRIQTVDEIQSTEGADRLQEPDHAAAIKPDRFLIPYFAGRSQRVRSVQYATLSKGESGVLLSTLYQRVPNIWHLRTRLAGRAGFIPGKRCAITLLERFGYSGIWLVVNSTHGGRKCIFRTTCSFLYEHCRNHTAVRFGAIGGQLAVVNMTHALWDIDKLGPNQKIPVNEQAKLF